MATRPLEFLGQLWDKFVECLGDDFFEITDRSGDRGLVNEQQFGDQFWCDVGAEVHDDGFDRLVQRQLPWPASSVIPHDALPDTVNKFVELLGRESCSSLAWQWSLRV